MRTATEILTDVAAALPDGTLRDEIAALICSHRHQVTMGRRMRLTAKEQRLFDVLALHCTVTNERLLDAAGISGKSALNVHKYRLNQKLRKFGYGEILAWRGIGYEYKRGANVPA